VIKFLVLCFFVLSPFYVLKITSSVDMVFLQHWFAELYTRFQACNLRRAIDCGCKKIHCIKKWTLYKQLKHTPSASSTSCPSSTGCTMIRLHLSPVTNLPSSRRTRLPHISARKPTAHLLRAPTIDPVP